MNAPFVPIDTCTGHELIQSCGNAKLPLRKAFLLARLPQAPGEDDQRFKSLGHVESQAGKAPTRLVTSPCVAYYEFRSIDATSGACL